MIGRSNVLFMPDGALAGLVVAVVIPGETNLTFVNAVITFHGMNE